MSKNLEHKTPSQIMLNEMTGVMKDMSLPEDKPDAFYKAIEKLFQGENLHFITELSEHDINTMIKMRLIWKWSDERVKFIEEIIEWKMKLRVSKQRRGRREFFETFRNRNDIEEERNRMGWKDRLFQPRY